MADQAKWKHFFTSRIDLSKTLRETFNYIVSFAGEADSSEQGLFRSAMNSLLFRLLNTDGAILPRNREVFRRLLEERFDHADVEKKLNELCNCTPIPEEDAVKIIANCDNARQQQIIEFMLSLAVELGNEAEKIAAVKNLAGKLGIPSSFTDDVYNRLMVEVNRKKRLISSGLGIIAAVALLLIFILTAKFLLSVIFGLIFACLLLPLEKFFERRLAKRRGLSYAATRIVHFIMLPLRSLSKRIMRRDNTAGNNNENAEKAASYKLIRQATVLTFVLTLLVVTLITAGISFMTTNYVRKIRLDDSIRQTLQDGDMSQVDYYLDKAQDRFEKLPPVRIALEFIEKALKDPKAREKILSAALRHGGGVFAFTADMLGVFVSLAANILLTIFFTLLFLMKLAEFCNKGDSDKQKSEYLIRSVFNGIWLPAADEETVKEARRVIEGVLFRLRVWLKGYFSLVLVDSTVYVTLFFFLGVPFCLPLGILAGCGIMLPYLGPVISCGITVLVTIAAGGATGTLLLSIIICYLIYNGIIEQFILYPAVIGEAIGLSTLETIIVVLLGAVFAGIPGMILAMPVASVAKYIIPQLYKTLPFKKIHLENK